jgi:hypothetical protein
MFFSEFVTDKKSEKPVMNDYALLGLPSFIL